MPTSPGLNLLLVDDDPIQAEEYRRRLSGPSTLVSREIDGERAHDRAMKTLFDVVIIDAKLDFRRRELGGVHLADVLHPRYGNSSIVIVSQYVNADYVNRYGASHEFVNKHHSGGIDRFTSQLRKTVKTLRKKQYLFVAMSYDPKLTPIYHFIKTGAKKCGFDCVRSDHHPHTQSMQTTLFHQITGAKAVILLADNTSPNAYLETGYALALNKNVIVIAKKHSDLQFDLKDRWALEYADNPRQIPQLIAQMLSSLRVH